MSMPGFVARVHARICGSAGRGDRARGLPGGQGLRGGLGRGRHAGPGAGAGHSAGAPRGGREVCGREVCGRYAG